MNGIYGTVIDNKDPKKIGRLKIKVNGYYDDISDEHIPWALPHNIAFNRLDPPPLKAVVMVKFIENEIMCPTWYIHNGKSGNDMNINDDQYIKSAVLLYKDLSEYDSSGVVRVLFKDDEGLTLEYKKDKKISHIQLRTDNSVIIENSKFGKVIHLAEKSISLGSEDKSNEPATLGDKNVDAFDMTNDTIKDMSIVIETFGKTMADICGKSAILSPLIVPFTKLTAELKAKISTLSHTKNKTFYPKTKSKIVTLD